MLEHWKKAPPLHRLFAAFVGYSQGESSAPAKKNGGFEITPKMLDAFGGGKRQICRQSQLDPRIRKSVEEFHQTPAYLNWRDNFRKKERK